MARREAHGAHPLEPAAGAGDENSHLDLTGAIAPGAGANAPADAGDDDGQAVENDPLAAARMALARAQRGAVERGFRPGSRPPKRRPLAGQTPRAGSGGRDGRDPQLLGNTMQRLLLDRGWNVDVAAGAVMSRWSELVGREVSDHAQPLTFENGVLTVRAESTAWATQLTLLASTLIASIERGIGAGVVTELKIVGPSSPSWVRGPRRVAGRGPRDTYG